MTLFRLSGGTAAQRQVVRLALQDVSKACNRGALAARASGPLCRQIVLDAGRFAPPDHDCEGFLHRPTPRSLVIALHPSLPDSQLYGVLLHELGHFFGLEHRTSGLMAPHYELRSWRRLTPSFRRRVVTELGRLLLEHTLSLLA